MRYLWFFLIAVITQTASAQTKKAYVKSNGGYTSNSKNAVGYVLVQKLNDSAYTVKQYDMRDTIIMQGIYRDESLKIPNGKFVYYKKNSSSDFTEKKYDIDEYIPVDTNNYVVGVGYYKDGKKTGNWITFWARNKKLTENTYDDDKLNGPFKVYDKFWGSWTEGIMQNDITIGSTFIYTPDSLVMAETKFKDGRPVGGGFVLKDAEPKYDLNKYLEAKLSQFKDVLAFASPMVAFTVDNTGKIIDARMVIGNSPEIDKAIIAAMLDAPLFEPALYKGAIVEDKLCQQFMLFRKNK